MASRKPGRQYDIVLLGATGYTGKLTAEYIVGHLPTNLKWAIGGRSRAKLEALGRDLKKLNSDRVQPAIEVVSLDDPVELRALLGRSTVCISIVGYLYVGAQVIEACIDSGTDYLDAFSAVPLALEWVRKYHKRAAAAGVALIHGCAAVSGPFDLITWAAVTELQKSTGLKTKEVILSIDKFELMMSGGTADAAMNGLSLMDPKLMKVAEKPWWYSPVQGQPPPKSTTNLLGIRNDPHLGTLAAASVIAEQNRAIVQRTWGLLDGGKQYGPNFQYNEYQKTTSTLAGALLVLNALVFGALLSFAPLRTLLKPFLPAPGEGPDVESSRKSWVAMEAVAVADTDCAEAPRVCVRARFPGASYPLSGAFLAQGAASLLYVRELGGGVRGGCLTPALLGRDLLERLKGAGAEIEVKVL